MTPPALPAAQPEPSDGALMVRYARGDDGAFSALFVRHARPLYCTLWCLLGDDEQAAAMVGQSFVWLHSQRRTQAAQGAFCPSLYGHAMALRRAADRASGVRVSQPGEVVPIRDAASLLRVLAGLPDSYREVLVLRYVAGLDSAQISTVLGATEAAVQQRLHQGLQQLAPALIHAASDAPPVDSDAIAAAAAHALQSLPSVSASALHTVACAVLPRQGRDRPRPRQIPLLLVLSGVLLGLGLLGWFVHTHGSPPPLP